MKWIPILLIIITSMSCKTKTPRVAINNSKIKAIKLMKIASYAVEVTDEMFWQSDYAHATMYLVDYNPYLENVTNLKRVKSNKCVGVTYSFISGNDTLYSDNSLKCWNFKEDGHMVYCYDDTGEIAKSLRTIPFFSECW